MIETFQVEKFKFTALKCASSDEVSTIFIFRTSSGLLAGFGAWLLYGNVLGGLELSTLFLKKTGSIYGAYVHLKHSMLKIPG